MVIRFAHLLSFCAALAMGFQAPDAHAQASGKVRVSGLQDVNFGAFPLGGDVVSSQSLCVFVATDSAAYSITAFGSGGSNEFALNSGSTDLPIDLMWAESAGQQSGQLLTANATSVTFTTLAVHQRCNRAPVATASLIVRVRETEISQAPAGIYSGTVTLIVAPS